MGSVRPGLLVDKVLINLKPTNFYLQSHYAIQGTTRSAHYHLLHDGMDLGDNLNGLTHILHSAFGRATTGVLYVAPAYIADRLCEKGRAYLRPWAENQDTSPVWNPLKEAGGKPFSNGALHAWKQKRALELAKNPKV
jgi:hypothetical protein